MPGATLLASTDRYSQQAFRLGRSYGLQFHPELTGQAWQQWLGVHEAMLVSHGKDVTALKAQAGKLDGARADITALVERLVNHFAHSL